MLGFITGVQVMAVLCRRLLVTSACLRQQLTVFERRHQRPSLQDKDRRFWILMHRFSSQWRQLLLIVEPETVLRWHQKGLARLLALEVDGKEAGKEKNSN